MGRPFNWILKYRIERVNGTIMPKADGMIRNETEENMPGELRKMAESLSEQFDFARVGLLATDISGKRTYQYQHDSQGGIRYNR